MIEIRTFEEDAPTAAEFTRRVWSDRYRLKIPVIDWSPEYFEWQLLWDRPGARDFLVAAYDGTKLVGTLFAERLTFQLRGEPFAATMGSWLSVDPEYRGHGIARKLADEQARRHREQDAKFMLGYGVLGTDGPKFWNSRNDTHVFGNVGFWVRVLDRRRVAEWAPTFRDRLAANLVGPILGGVPDVDPTPEIRRFEPRDLAACLSLARTVEQSAELGYRWTEERLMHQLAGKMARTFVFEKEGAAAGFVNYYLVGMTGRSFMPVAVIDLLALGSLDRSERKRLMLAALAAMAEEGAGLAMLLRLPCFSSSDLWAAGFAPTPKDSCFLFTVVDPSFSFDGVRDLHVHWR